MIIDRLRRCYSCGSLLNQNLDVSKYPPDIQDALAARCVDCAKEVLGITTCVGAPHTFQRDTGGGNRVIKSGKEFS